MTPSYLKLWEACIELEEAIVSELADSPATDGAMKKLSECKVYIERAIAGE